MKVSLNTIKRLVDFELPSNHELIERINQQLGGVEETIELEAKYKGIVVVRVVRATKHPNADKLTVCMVDDNGEVDGVERDEDGFVQVVCGAPNVREGMTALWLPPGSTVPASIGTSEPFVLSVRELRGVVSNGMLAAADELAIGADHEGIVSLDIADLPEGVDGRALSPGQDFAEAFGLDDTIIDIENKMFTHRPDCFGQLGVAREVAGILHEEFTSPAWYVEPAPFQPADGVDLEVVNEAIEHVPRFMAVGIDGVTVGPSPFWLQCELVRMGAKPINNVVDITNYMMLLTGQPLHAYDYDKLHGWKLGARLARPGETITLINGKTYELDEADIVIADNEGVVGLGGVMGGMDSEVSASTKTIVLECATFDMYTIRRTSMRHGLFTDAVTRFNKGQSPLQTPAVMAKALELMTALTGGTQASLVGDAHDENSVADRPVIGADAAFISSRLGKEFSVQDITNLLGNVEITVTTDDKHDTAMHIQAPFWRTDLELPEDVVEEVGRLYGLDRLPRELPLRTMAPTPRNIAVELKRSIRESLARMGANEVLTYSFVHKNTIERADQNPDDAFELSNALSPDLQYYRLTVLPSLLDKVHSNAKAGFDEFAMFEIGKGHAKTYAADADGLPIERQYVDIVYTSKHEHTGAPFYRARRLVEQLAQDLSVKIQFIVMSDDYDAAVCAPFDLTRSALVIAKSGEPLGVVGELKQPVAKKFKLPQCSAAASLDFEALARASAHKRAVYEPLSKYPSITNDISLKTSQNVPYGALVAAAVSGVEQKRGDVTCHFEPVAIYQADDDTAFKTTTFRLTVTSAARTLTDEDVRPLVLSIAKTAQEQCSAQLV